MTDYKEKYEKLLESYSRLEKETGYFRLKGAVNKINNNQIFAIPGKISDNVLEEIFETISNYLALFSVEGDGRIVLIALNTKAEEVECVKKDLVSGKIIDDTPLSNRSKLIELIWHVKITEFC